MKMTGGYSIKRSRTAALAAVFAILLMVAGCGQRGPLTLPKPGDSTGTAADTSRNAVKR